MKIGIIGTGNMAGGLGRLVAGKGHEVFFGSRSSEKAITLAKSVGHNARGGSYLEAARFGDIVLLATPWTGTKEAVRAAGGLEGKIVIECTNPLAEGDYFSLAIGHNTSAAEEIAKCAPKAKVVQAFNTVFSSLLTSGSSFGTTRPTVFYCGDDKNAKETASHLIEEIGFEPVDAGVLKNARYIEPLAELMIQLGYGMGLGPNIALKLLRG